MANNWSSNGALRWGASSCTCCDGKRDDGIKAFEEFSSCHVFDVICVYVWMGMFVTCCHVVRLVQDLFLVYCVFVLCRLVFDCSR